MSHVIAIVADALGHPPADVTPYASLIDDLGGVDRLHGCIVFRLEDAFQTVIPNEQLWAGSIDVTMDDPDAIAAGIIQLRQYARVRVESIHRRHRSATSRA